MQQPGRTVLYVRNLNDRVDAARLLRECVHPSRIDVSQREAYILFQSRAAAQTNRNNLNGMVMDGQRMYCHIVQHHSEIRKVILTQLPANVSHNEIRAKAIRYGIVSRIWVGLTPHGTAFVTFATRASVVACVAGMDGWIVRNTVVTAAICREGQDYHRVCPNLFQMNQIVPPPPAAPAPGYKLFLAGVSRDNITNEERQIKLSSRKYYNLTRQNIRDRKCKQWTADFENKCKAEREQFHQQYGSVLSPQSRTYPGYIAHRLKHFDEGITLYTTPKYTRLAFDQFICAKSTMDGLLNDLITVPANSSQRCLIVIGGSEFPSNSPIKKYRRCPGVRKLVTASSKRPNCDVVFADEYNTSQVCARCFRKFKTTPEEEQKHKRWEGAGHRHRSCSDCCPSEQLLPLPIKIHTKLSPAEVTISMLEQAHTNFTQYNVTYEEAKQHAMQTCYRYGNILHYKAVEKETQQSYADRGERQTPLKTVWNRDVSAGKNILIKGICLISNQMLPPSLQRPTTDP